MKLYQVLWKENVKLKRKMNEQLVVSDGSTGETSMTHFHVLCFFQQSKMFAKVFFSPTHIF